MSQMTHDNRSYWKAIGLLLIGVVLLAIQPDQGGSAPAALAAQQAAIVSQQVTLNATTFAASGSGHDVDFTLQGIALTAPAMQGVYHSHALAAPLNYTTDIALLWEADIPQGAEVKLQIRFSADGVTWEAWRAIPVEQDAGAGAYRGPLFWVERSALYVQIMATLQTNVSGVTPLLKILTVVFNDASAGPTAPSAPQQMAGQCSVNVVSRAAWGCPDGATSPRWPPTAQNVTHVVLNHTATANTATDWAKVVRAIWNYHANTLGWGDIGYHYLIDPNGVVYEGRAGGESVVGAYDGFNHGSLGIGYIGCYGNCEYLGIASQTPPTAMLDAGNILIAEKLYHEKLDPYGSGPYCDATHPTIVCRRDVLCRGASYSPGDRLCERLADIREDVKQIMVACWPTEKSSLSITPGSLTLAMPDNGVNAITANVLDNALCGFKLQLTFDPAVVSLANIVSPLYGVIIKPGNGFIDFEASSLTPPPSQHVTLATLTWNPQQAGNTALTLSGQLYNCQGALLPTTIHNGEISVTAAGYVTGRVLLQGRSTYTETLVRLTESPCPAPASAPGLTCETEADGDFAFAVASSPLYQCVYVTHRGYLSGQKRAPQGQLGTLTLLGGDINNGCQGDNTINIYDLSLIGGCHEYGNQNCIQIPDKACADLTADGVINIFDLVMAAVNFGKSGPLEAWK